MALSLNETIKHEKAKDRTTRPWQFKKGQSGNPDGGRRHVKFASSAFNAQELARTHTKEGIATLVFYMRQRSNAALAVRAAELLLNRAWGVPSQDIKLNADLTVSIATIVHDARQRAINTLEKPLESTQAIEPSPQATLIECDNSTDTMQTEDNSTNNGMDNGMDSHESLIPGDQSNPNT